MGDDDDTVLGMAYTELVTMKAMTCGGCGITFGVPEKWHKEKMEAHGRFRCPNGCSRQFTAETESEKFKAEAESERREAARLREKAFHAERAQKKAETALNRHKKRAAAGVCPCCNRTVKQLSDHMKSKHSDFLELQGVKVPKQLTGEVSHE